MSPLFGELTPQTITPTELVNASGFQTSLLTTLQPWIVAGLGIGVTVFALWMGWKYIKRFMK